MFLLGVCPVSPLSRSLLFKKAGDEGEEEGKISPSSKYRTEPEEKKETVLDEKNEK